MAGRNLNKVQLIGNLTRDPELRYTPSGTAVCSFGLATNRSWTTDGGERKEATEFHRIVSWNKLAELCSQLLAKGRKVYVEGRLQTRSWQTQDGQQRTTTEIVISDMIILDSRRQYEQRLESRGKSINISPSTPSVQPDTVDKQEKPVEKIQEEVQVDELTEKPKDKEVKKETLSKKNNEEKAAENVNPDEIPF